MNVKIDTELGVQSQCEASSTVVFRFLLCRENITKELGKAWEKQKLTIRKDCGLRRALDALRLRESFLL